MPRGSTHLHPTILQPTGSMSFLGVPHGWSHVPSKGGDTPIQSDGGGLPHPVPKKGYSCQVRMGLPPLGPDGSISPMELDRGSPCQDFNVGSPVKTGCWYTPLELDGETRRPVELDGRQSSRVSTYCVCVWGGGSMPLVFTSEDFLAFLVQALVMFPVRIRTRRTERHPSPVPPKEESGQDWTQSLAIAPTPSRQNPTSGGTGE